jgi:predicted acylesterase/phospholipase RssA
MRLLISPGSEANFLAQIVMLQHLSQVNYKPTLCFGSSGGNLSNYIACAADFSWSKIALITKELKPSYFVKPWHEFPPLSILIGFFNGTAFTYGQGLVQFLETYFDEQSIVKYELWTSCYNKDLQKLRLFCNCAKSASRLCYEHYDLDLIQCQEPHYCDGDFELIATVGLSSASIPGLARPQWIQNHQYIDGSTCGASPLTLFQGSVRKTLKHDDQLHMVYLNSKDLSEPHILPHHTMIDTWKQGINDLLKSQTLIDRLAAYELLKSRLRPEMEIKKKSCHCNYENLQLLFKIIDGCSASLLEIYPKVSANLNITNFTSEDIEKNLELLYDACECHLWWIC